MLVLLPVLTKAETIINNNGIEISEEDYNNFLLVYTPEYIMTMDEVISRSEDKNKELWICFKNMDNYLENANNLKQIALQHPGFTPVYVQLREEMKMKKLANTVNVRTGIVDALKLEYGPDMVLVREKKS